jgi:hypothetical protein
MGIDAAHRRVSRRAALLVAAMIAAGTVARLVLAFTTYGARFDVGSYRVVYEGLVHHHLHMYSAVNGRAPDGKWVIHWPYAPGFVPWIVVARQLQLHTHLVFHTLIKLPAVAADGALAWVAQDAYARMGRPSRDRLFACALIALGPPFAFISGYHGQIDAVAILPAVVAVYGWHRWPALWRPLACGLLIGIGAAIKPVPLLAVVPLIAVAPTRRDRVVLALSSVAVPALLLSPFAIADPQGVLALRRYGGFPGLGGISLLVQPTLVLRYLRGPVHISSAEQFLIAHGTTFALVATCAVAALVLRARLRPWRGEYVLFLSFFVLFPFYARSYLVWLLPFVVLAGHLRLAATIQALGFGAAIAGFFLPDAAFIHLALLMALLAVAVGAAVHALAGAWRARPPTGSASHDENLPGRRLA